MKVGALFLLVVFPSIFCGPVPPVDERHISEPTNNVTYLLVERSDGSFVVEDLLQPLAIEIIAKEADIKFYLYTRENMNEPQLLQINGEFSLADSKFDPSKETLFITHGWQNDYTSSVNEEIKKAALNNYDVNIFVVDWSAIAKELYLICFANINRVGGFVAQFIKEISTTYDYPLSKITAVGHSLGAHVTGVAGKGLHGKISHIVALDPAGPLFTPNDVQNSVTTEDAEYVEVIHTGCQILGLTSSIGHADYYPNGGAHQPGCSIIDDLAGTCSHSRSYHFYAESLGHNGFVATQCGSYAKYKNGDCDGNVKSLMGGFKADKTATGIFYLNTASEDPYALG